MDKTDRIYRIVELLHKYRKGELDASEEKEWNEWMADEKNRELVERLASQDYEEARLREFRQYDVQKAYRKFLRKQTKYVVLLRWTWVAASLMIPVLLAVVWFLKTDVSDKRPLPVAKHLTQAGGKHAVLTLAGGQKVVLGKEQPAYTRDTTGILIKADSARLVYERKTDSIEVLAYNELYVPRKGEYCLQLADGTRIYLNADSRLRYPETFGKNRREVELSGEAFFEVQRDSLRPFIVKVGEMQVQVLGTEFNVNAYGEVPDIRTTLVSGKVKVEYPGAMIELAPGEQACLNKSTASLCKEKVNVALYTAWKDGLFKFERESLENIMLILERWYDVNVFFRNDALRESLFTGDLKKYATIEEHLHMLELTTNVSFVVQGNNVFIGYKH